MAHSPALFPGTPWGEPVPLAAAQPQWVPTTRSWVASCQPRSQTISPEEQGPARLPHPAWLPAPQAPKLSGPDVAVWRVALDQPPERVAQNMLLLAADERERAARFASEQARGRYVVARATLRTILGAYLECDPAAVRFRYGLWGKPELVSRFGGKDIQFNVSHSAGLGLCAVTRGRRIGIDVEQMRTLRDAESIAARFFSPRERTAIDSLPEGQRQAAFLSCWTRKEAFIKATGEGLAQPLERFAVSVLPDKPAQVLQVDGDPDAGSRWTLEAFTPDPGYVAALAVEGKGWCLRWYAAA
jgi:4'-phosphopantetheinyl transferase